MQVLSTSDLIGDWEFEMRVGRTKQEIAALAAAWPHLNAFTPLQANVAINNCLNEVCHAFSAERVAWYGLFRPDAEHVFEKWRGLNPTLPEQKILTDEEAEMVKEEMYRRVEETMKARCG